MSLLRTSEDFHIFLAHKLNAAWDELQTARDGGEIAAASEEAMAIKGVLHELGIFENVNERAHAMRTPAPEPASVSPDDLAGSGNHEMVA